MWITVKRKYQLIIQNSADHSVFMIKEAKGWTLPCVRPEEQESWQEVEILNRLVYKEFGISAITLRCMDISYTSHTQSERVRDSNGKRSRWVPPAGGHWAGEEAPKGHTLSVAIRGVYAMQASSIGSSKRGEWIRIHNLSGLKLASQEHGIILKRWFAWAAQHRESALRVPWFEDGWYKEREAWIQKEPSLKAWAIVGITQLRAWQRSAILRISTRSGDLYYKEVPKVFSHELYLSRELQRLFPENVPSIIKLDSERCAILMSDVGGVSLSRVSDVRHWETAVCLLADIQVRTLTLSQHFLDLGCFDQRLENILRCMDSIFSDTSALKAGRIWALSEREIERVHSCLPKLKLLCLELQNYKLPSALEHGDLWPTNILIKGETCIYLDWSDSSISHPFFSVPVLLQAAANSFPQLRNLGEHLRNLYLEAWTDYAPMDCLIKAFELSQRLAPLHHCMLYLQHLLPGMVVKWEMENMVPYYLRKVLEQI